jgi:hypothetical protein
LQLQTDHFRRQGQLQDEEMETVIEELKRDMEAQEDWGGDEEATSLNGHQRVLEAVNERLLQVHRIAPNSKEDRIFQLMCENANRFNNRINGNK